MMTHDEIIELCLPYTGLSVNGLESLFKDCEGLDDVPGAVVECGVANGGSAAVLWHAAGSERELWLFDSFQGLPEPTTEDGGRAAAQYAYRHNRPEGWCKGSIEKVWDVVDIARVPLELVTIVPGWFADTLPDAVRTIGPIAALHIDVDWYQSTKDVLHYLYPLVSPGGVVIVDDYDAWPGCKLAVDEFFAVHRELGKVATTWRKPR